MNLEIIILENIMSRVNELTIKSIYKSTFGKVMQELEGKFNIISDKDTKGRKIFRHGEQVYFNIFEDTNQNIYSKGILSWEEISGVASNLYSLNENYTNTVEITSYCNERFDFNHLFIGINGKEVRHINIEMSLSEVKEIINLGVLKDMQ